jgi:hypothetical protein
MISRINEKTNGSSTAALIAVKFVQHCTSCAVNSDPHKQPTR